jgi:hypothetical protein
MADLFGSVRRAVHDTSIALIDNDIPTKVSDLVTSTVRSGFDIVENLLTIVKDLTAESEEEAPARGGRKAARRPAR